MDENVTFDELWEAVKKGNSRRKMRILSQEDVTEFLALLAENKGNPEFTTLRVYPARSPFVAHNYGFRAEVVYVQATRHENTFSITVGVADAHRDHGNGASRTINGRAI
jgi:hypothetical protein